MPWDKNIDPSTPAHKIASSVNSRIRVLAGPGTGKSFAMCRRVARLLEADVAPERILPVTFTRVAAADLHSELVGMGVTGCEALKATTLHSLALRMLLQNHVPGAYGRVPRPLNEYELEPLIADLAGRHGGRRRVGDLKQAYEAAWARLQSEQPGFEINDEEAAFQNDLVEWLQFHEGMLVGEVIPHIFEYFRANPAAQERVFYRHILFDEYQDLNRVEQAVIELLSDNADVCIVGDDDQSIYSFKYAHPEGILSWIDETTDTDDFRLANCHRCPTRVVEMANSLIKHNETHLEDRHLEPLPDKGLGEIEIIQYQSHVDEFAGIAELIASMVSDDVSLSDILVLTQSRAFGVPIFDALSAKGILTKSYYAESELKDREAQRAYSLLKLLISRDDRVALRWLLGVDGNNWNTAGYIRIRRYCEDHNLSPWSVLELLSEGEIQIPYTTNIQAAYNVVINSLNTIEALPSLRSIVDYLFPEESALTKDIRDLALKTLDEFGEDDQGIFVRELSTAIIQLEASDDANAVRIMSLHKSKGLSAPVTIIAGCVQGLLPRLPKENLSDTQRALHLEEQRRLFYVGITRVKAVPDQHKPGKLIMTYSQQMPKSDALRAGIRPARLAYDQAVLHASQFINELGPSAPDPVCG